MKREPLENPVWPDRDAKAQGKTITVEPMNLLLPEMSDFRRHTQKNGNCALYLELPLVGYRQAHALQLCLVEDRREGRIEGDIFLLLEHPPVFTLGRRGGMDNVTAPDKIFGNSGIPLIHVERGGDITYHGPGQLVLYPIVDLKKSGLGVVDFVHRLEEIMIRISRQWGVAAERNPINRGVWVDRTKLGSVGIAVRRGITFHGLALNVDPSLEPFDWIRPCGLHGVGVTSLSRECRKRVDVIRVRKHVKGHIEAVFHTNLTVCRPSDLPAQTAALLREHRSGAFFPGDVTGDEKPERPRDHVH